MLSNEVRLRRNPREMRRISQWNGDSSMRVKRSKTLEPRKATDRKLSGSRIENDWRMEERRDSRLFEKVHCDCGDNNNANFSFKIFSNSSENRAEMRSDRPRDSSGHEESDKHSRCECECIEHADRIAITSNSTSNLHQHFTRCCSFEGCKNRHSDNVRWTRWTAKNIFRDRSSWRAFISIILMVLLSVPGIQAAQRPQCALGIDTPGG